MCLCVLILPLLFAVRPYALEQRVRATAEPYAFNLVEWEAAQLRQRLPGLLSELREPPSGDNPRAYAPSDVAVVRRFFTAVEDWRDGREAGVPPDALEALRAVWEGERGTASAAMARNLDGQARNLALTTASPIGDLLLPPTSFEVTAPPRVLVVSPRDRVEVAHSVLLRPDVTTAAAETLEEQVDRLGLSGLVVTIGGIATYPAIVPLQRSPVETLSAVAHEWLHGYLFFQPLGQAYFTSYDGRMLNETVANLGGRELGRLLAESLGLPAQPAAREGAADRPPDFDFRQEMRDTRQRLDALLAEGRISEAEEYLHRRRQDFVAAGYPIRKLNQAYFAFNGSYGDSPASVTPLDRQVRALRAASPDLGTFLRRVAQMTSSAEVAAAVGESGVGP